MLSRLDWGKKSLSAGDTTGTSLIISYFQFDFNFAFDFTFNIIAKFSYIYNI